LHRGDRVESIRGLLALSDRFPAWNVTLAVEPILLTQLRDMTDGYVYVGSAGEPMDAGENELAAQNAALALSELSDLAARESVEVVVSPIQVRTWAFWPPRDGETGLSRCRWASRNCSGPWNWKGL